MSRERASCFYFDSLLLDAVEGVLDLVLEFAHLLAKVGHLAVLASFLLAFLDEILLFLGLLLFGLVDLLLGVRMQLFQLRDLTVLLLCVEALLHFCFLNGLVRLIDQHLASFAERRLAAAAAAGATSWGTTATAAAVSLGIELSVVKVLLDSNSLGASTHHSCKGNRLVQIESHLFLRQSWFSQTGKATYG